MTTGPRFSEDARQLVHMAAGSFALLLRYLSWWQAALVGATALAFNIYALPRLAGDRLFRPGEGAGRQASGIILYPASVLALILIFPARPDIVAAAWGILAVGDGLATLIGRRLRSPRIPWNRHKSVGGSITLAVFGGVAGACLCWWCQPAVGHPVGPWFSIGGPFVAAIAAAAVETIPVRLDDNVSVPAAAAAVLWWLSLMSGPSIQLAAGSFATALPAAMVVNALVAFGGYFARTVSVSGAVAGFALGVVIVLAAGWAGWILLLATFACAVLSSRLGLRRKTLLGIEEPHGGRRGAGNALANTGAAAAAALLAVASPYSGMALIAFVAALAAGGSDTMASEIGKAWGRRAYLVSTLRRVAPGTSGAISIEGTLAGLVGAVALASLGAVSGLIPAWALAAVVAGATIGAFAESVMGATLEGPGYLNNDMLNFLNTAIAAGVAVLLAGGLN
jgi:uncharacterized protein (TIGR00297 family)